MPQNHSFRDTDSWWDDPFTVRVDGYRTDGPLYDSTEPANWLLGATELVDMGADVHVDDNSEEEHPPSAGRPSDASVDTSKIEPPVPGLSPHGSGVSVHPRARRWAAAICPAVMRPAISSRVQPQIQTSMT